METKPITEFDGKPSHGARSIDQLKEQAQDGSCGVFVTDGWSARLLGRRLVWKSKLPRFSSVTAILSSRLGHLLDEQDEWFQAFQHVFLTVSKRQTLFANTKSTTAAPYLGNAIRLFGRKQIRVEIPRDHQTVHEWIENTRSLADEADDVISFSPLIQAPSDAPTQLPLRDLAMASVADRVFVLKMTKWGNVRSIVQKLLEHPHRSGRIFLLANSRLVDPECFQKFCDQGAIGWHLWQNDGRKELADRDVSNPFASPIIPLPQPTDGDFLSHWTRRQKGAWPDQTADAFTDELILGKASKDRSALASLARIISSQEITATFGNNRAHEKTVCFTEVPLAAWAAQRTYRRHKMRWDFELYGICIRKSWLRQFGVQSVHYGDEELYEKLSPAERPFFQLAKSVSKQGNEIDWTGELEWRVVGNVDLTHLPSDSAFVFVPSQDEANHIRRFSKWPVAILDHGL